MFGGMSLIFKVRNSSIYPINLVSEVPADEFKIDA